MSNDVLDFSKQAAIVTGGATGIGESCARLLASRGATVTVMDIDAAGANRVVAAIRENGGRASAAVVDLTNWGATKAAVEAAHAESGRLDIMIHSAGGFPRYVTLLDCEVEAWDAVVNSNLKSMFHMLKAVAPLMMPARYGRVVSVSSMAVRGSTVVSGPHYSSAKAGLLGLTRHAARVLGPHGITVNSVAPGSVNTPRTMAIRTEEATRRIQQNTPLGRLCEPEEVAWPILFLCSREAGYITGATLDVNGGGAMN
jgi:3-oxoacyl-[acyl-carrier protein] reductase